MCWNPICEQQLECDFLLMQIETVALPFLRGASLHSAAHHIIPRQVPSALTISAPHRLNSRSDVFVGVLPFGIPLPHEF